MSDRALRMTMLVIAFIGLGVATYLTIVHYSGGVTPCLGGGAKTDPCVTVQHSVYSELAGVPVALIGLIGYLSIFVSLLAPRGETTRLATVAFTTVGFGFSCYLTARELFSLEAICPWCVSSAVIMTILFCLSVWRFLRGDVAGGASDAEPGRASLA